ncbi:CHAT domain-containing protein [Diplogelasinospora grovesii]|uniref:CHAT domain-containing protein n=1 Tax=Diplogelasinospora grovesii TaxID=303347 RepID=A0AAN6N2M4_9PEZI|nr:CHAT domain-containing protein [Diplogelasinospora grovesii]
MAALETIIQQLEEALEATPENHPERAGRLHSLGAGYGNRYRRTGAEADLEKAIRQFEEALKATPEDHPDRARRLQDLGIGYGDRYLITRAEADLKRAIQQFEKAIKAMPENHPEKAGRLHDLGAGYHKRYQRMGAEADLEKAIQQFEEALEATPEDHPERAGRLHSLGVGYGNRYQRMGAEADLERAIQQFEEALNATPGDHPERAGRLHSLGAGYRDKYLRTGAVADLEKAIRQLEEALSHSSSPILDRLRPSRDLLILYTTAERWLLAYQVAFTAVSLIALLTPQSLDHSDKQHLLIEVNGLASEAAAIALMAEQSPYEAIRLLELGRGVIIGSLNDMRVDISDLQDKYPLLAQEFIKLRDRLDAPARQIAQSTAVTHQVNQRYDAGQKLERLLKDIRDLPGFSRFLLAPSEAEIKAAAASGPIVVINVSDHRCDALIVETSELRTLRLSQLHSSDIRTRAAELTNPESLSTQLLEWLWDTIAKPVLDVLGLTNSPGSRWPRIWWIPTGPVAKFPIHAAGYHSRGSDTVLDRVISSYTSSIRGIIQGRQNRAKTKAVPKPGKAVLVGMKELRFAPQEINKLERHCGSMHLRVCKPRPCQSDVLAALDDCDIFHFAGHGVTDAKDPSNSYLKLYDGPLAVKSLFGINLHNRKPFLAYLSACGTGQIAHEELIDEGLHLIAAC